MDKTAPVKALQNPPAGLDLGAEKSGVNRFWRIFFQLLQLAAAGWFVWFYYRTVRANWGEIERYGFHPNRALFSLGAFLFFAGHSYQPLAFWLNFRLSGVAVSVWNSYKLYSMAHLAHYLPGRIWSYLSFAYLGKFLGIETPRLLAALYLGFAASLFSGAVFSIFALPLVKSLAHPYLVLGLTLGVLLILFYPPVFHTIIRVFAKIARRRLSELPRPFGFAAINLASLSYGVSWLLNSAGVVLMTAAFHPLTFKEMLFAFSAFPVGYLAGYLAFFTAGGLGVREGAMLAVFSSFLPLYAAAVVPIAARILAMTFEAVWFIVAYNMPWRGQGKDGK
jgi:hypothetical protein